MIVPCFNLCSSTMIHHFNYNISCNRTHILFLLKSFSFYINCMFYYFGKGIEVHVLIKIVLPRSRILFFLRAGAFQFFTKISSQHFVFEFVCIYHLSLSVSKLFFSSAPLGGQVFSLIARRPTSIWCWIQRIGWEMRLGRTCRFSSTPPPAVGPRSGSWPAPEPHI